MTADLLMTAYCNYFNNKTTNHPTCLWNMSEVERALMDLLNGRPSSIPLTRYDICRKPAGSGNPSILGQNLCIIVAAVVFNASGEVVLIQEAKKSCRGHWYYPAGRLEPNETLVEGVKREFEEETGLTFEPTTLVNVESYLVAGYWMRFTFTGYLTGGVLKTPDRADKESLQAGWFSLDQIKNSAQNNISFRSSDFIPIIEKTFSYLMKPLHGRHQCLLPVLQPHKHMCMRIILVKTTVDKEVQVLLNMEDTPHFPTVKDAWQADDSLYRLSMDAFKSKNYHGTKHILCVEHIGRPHRSADGVCLNVLTNVQTNRELVNNKYMWHTVTHPEVRRLVAERLEWGMGIACP